MANIKTSKKSTRIDMTAMCDVAFLLLSFFIMTATAKVPEPKPVDTPASTVKAKLPERNLLTITIGDSAVYLGMSDRETRIAALEAMSLKYDIAFTPQEINEFSLLDSFGVPLEQLKSLLALPNAQRNRPGTQSGIPYAGDISENELSDWVFYASEAVILEQQGRGVEKLKEIEVAIKGGSKEKYPVVKRVFDILQKQNVNNFYLVTSLRSEDF
ncbi:ExbD/TolR family protein [Flavobacterium terrigena]|uniref:Biopolymer transport protein ExbD/TolR n=1 Tax=Flavobacterium terrigena TaxID=402734 RepID=A0A1H6WJL7_9FLAO|nr:biopolymer transporter ExbD [Flavobacterium terrigena]SEJ17073.1 Biopolymer transport protein ExbD/TolR [Flavobacterium terrigena]